MGLFGFGGGPSMIPLVQSEVVTTRRWMDDEQFMDAFAFANALPGPITTKMGGYVGYRVAGWPGALSALLGLTVPTIFAMVVIAALYLEHRDNPLVAGFMNGVRPVVIGLLVLVVWEFAPKAFVGKRTLPLWLLALGAFAASVWLGVHPAVLIVAGGVAGFFIGRQG